jgi:hypothetical protein
MFLSTVFAAIAALGQGPSVSASVDDPNSHGTLGDNLLSLDEAIQVANGTLLISQLSAAEQARISGSGLVTVILVDAATTPTITLQAPLTAITGPAGAVDPVTITGTAAGGALPVLAGNTQATILNIQTHLTVISGFRLENGAVAVDAIMPAASMMAKARVGNCEFDGQSSAAVQVRGVGSDNTNLMVHDSSIRNTPLGFRLDDQATSGIMISENERITMDGVTLGCEVNEAGAGMMTMWQFWRSTFVNGETLARTTRSPTSDKLMMLRIVHSDAICTGDVIDMTGTAAGTSMLHHHHGDWTAGPGKRAIWTHPRTAQFDIHGSEMEFHGDVELAAGSTSPRIWQQNNYYQNCAITFDIDGALPNLIWNRYDNCTIDVPSLARSPVKIRDSQLSNTSISSQSFLAPIDLEGCYRSGGSMTGFATETAVAPAEFLGTTTITPEEPQLGSTLQISADLPSGISLIWDFADSFARPVTSTEPVRFYGDPATAAILPVVVINQSTILLTIPTNTALVGLEFYVQGISVPWMPMPYAPAFHLPRGSLVRLTL